MRRRDLASDPLSQFRAWFEEARRGAVAMPETMTVATATPDGRPSARQVLLKGFDERGFVFFTGYGSRKGRELAANPQAALLFHWAPLGRQVRIEGRVERVSAEESDAYFGTRPPGSRLSAAASSQSDEIASREELEQRVEQLRAPGGEIARPGHWGGFRVIPDGYEFWEHRDDRLHDRFRYRPAGAAEWKITRLQP